MELIIDIGNSRSKLALFQDAELLRHAVRERDEGLAVTSFLEGTKADACIISSVRENIPEELETPSFLPGIPFLLDHNSPLPIGISLQEPHNIGPDRLANAAAAAERWPSNDVLVMDMGTCITYERVRKGELDGGAISPGMKMRAQAMNRFTARLPEVPMEGPPPQYADNTTAALQSGIHFGVLHEIKGRSEAFLRDHSAGVVVITGGDAPLIGKDLKKGIFADPFLTLRGLDAILRFNS